MSGKRKITALAVSAAVLLISVVTTFAWFAKLNSAKIDKNGGSVVTRYFHKGDGTQENPYEITRPVHFYNLVMLYQANPEFKGTDFITSSTYFRIGTKDLDLDGVDELKDYSVFKYDDSGKTDNKSASDTLNMAVYGDGVLPIGSPQKPFQATLDGENITIKNLKITGSASLNGKDYTTADIGLFGYVSNNTQETDQPATIKNLYVENMTIDLTKVDVSGENLGSSTSVKHSAENHKDHSAYVGYIAGHIITGAQVNDVYVNNCTVTGGNAATSGFGFFGCVEDENGVVITTLGSEIATQRTKGDEAGFGGSVDMMQMQKRLQSIFSRAELKETYNSEETIVINENDGTRTVTESSPKNINFPNSNYKYKYYSSPYAGKYYFYQRDDMKRYGYQFMCMYGDSSVMPKTVNKYTVTTEDIEAFYISDGSVYLKAAANGVSAADKNGASKWSFDENGHIFAYVNNDVYYLNRKGLSGVAAGATAETVWLRGTENTLYTSVNGIDYFLNYSSGWKISSFTQYCYISDGNGNFLSAANGTGGAEVTNARSESESVKWQVTVSGNKYKFRTEVGDKSCYLTANGSLVLSESANADDIFWTLEDGGYFTRTVTFGNVSVKYRLVYDNGWKAAAVGKHITDGNNNYLSADTTRVKNATESGALVWQTQEDANGIRFYTFINSVPYYISFNPSAGLTVSESPFLWKKDGNSYCCTVNGKDYFIRYNNGWEAATLEYRLISDGNGNYLKADGSNAFSRAQRDNATRFYFSNSENNSGTVYYYIDETRCYLGVSSDGKFADTASGWTFTTDGYLKADNMNYYLVYDGGWKIADNSLKYTISDGSNYLNINSSGNGITSGTNQSTATKWTFSNTNNSSAPSGTISVKTASGAVKYLGVESSWWGSSSLTLSTSGTRWTNSNGYLSYNNKYIAYDRWWGWTASDRQSRVYLNPIRDEITSVSIETGSDGKPEITVRDNSIPETAVTVSAPIAENYELGFEKTSQKKITKETKQNAAGGYQTYFPLRIADEKETGWYDSSDPFKVSQKNTGYIISGARIADSATTADDQKASGDIRISYFPIKADGDRSAGIEGSYNSSSNTFSKIYTVDGSGKHVYTANSAVYTEASKQLLETLKGSSYVYGLHFMDAEISKDHLVTANKAVILGKEYNNYEMPMDSIDFNVIERGSISFFAGAYFNGNNTFFSLHQVFRNENTNIKEIKEIKEIYQHKDYKALRPYIYRFSDGTYSNADGNYTGATTIDTSVYTSVFKTEWITKPTGMKRENIIYYFEIPCNKGEYCLGSVSEGTGAYLIYLDIASNGGDAISKIISSEGNAVTNAFKAEYRTSPNRLGKDDYSVLLFSTTAPQGTNKDGFSVNMTFEKKDPGDPDYEPDYANGVYVLTVTNKSGADIQLDVYLCDDDRDITNDFLYAYKIVYNNKNRTRKTIPNILNSDYWQAMASFNIPSSGDAKEISYQ